jgi:hypothetical protein
VQGLVLVRLMMCLMMRWMVLMLVLVRVVGDVGGLHVAVVQWR